MVVMKCARRHKEELWSREVEGKVDMKLVYHVSVWVAYSSQMFVSQLECHDAHNARCILGGF
jgi:hypothetical protein